MTEAQVCKVLEEIGCSKEEISIYLLLTTSGSEKTARQINETLKIKLNKLYIDLRNLENKALVRCTGRHPQRFYAVKLEKVIERIIKTNLSKAKRLENGKEKTLFIWRSMLKK